jgi:DNA-binding LacI/PurR family transcriptional regulator
MPSGQVHRPTLRDVADKVGVSYQTVWRVVNDRPHVAEDTRLRVQQALEALNYRPHRAAQVLTTGRSYMLQLVLFEYGHSDRLPAILRWAREYGYSVVATELEGPPSVDAMRAALSTTSQIIDGLILVLPYPDISYEMLQELIPDRPFVVINTELNSRMPSVVTNQWAGAREAVQHLMDLGHREIAEIRGPIGHFDADIRHRACEVFLGQNGLDPGLTEVGNFSVCSGYACTKRLLARGALFTGLVAGNDYMALGAIRALYEDGRRVPDDISVVGFDDIPEAAYFSPPLTTVRQDFEALGKACIEFLVSLIEDPDVTVHQRVLYPELIIRQSTQSPLASS